MSTVNKGDIVRFLNSVGGGEVVRIENNIAYVEDEDGFENPVLVKECVVVGHASKAPSVEAPVVAPVKTSFEKEIQPTAIAYSAEEPEIPIEETPEGNVLNVVLAYEPKDLKQLSTTRFDTYIVNDSNYYLYFAYMSRSRSDQMWTTKYAGIVEPNIQLFLEEITAADLPEMDRMAVQYIAFKKQKPFEAKQPQMVEVSLDTTKFAKLHCFKDNIYFESPVLAIDVVTNDHPLRETQVDSRSLEKAMKSKISADRRPRQRIVKKQAKQSRRGDIIVVDLHIGELVDSIAGLSNADMLNLQVDEFMRVMDENLRNKGQKIVFIHGKGEGVLRNAIMKELRHRYKGHDVQDASFREYGFGATQVTIR
ncbi:MAG: DUF2027 domain-containing protein [Bacteroides sp.]|nr:DUF2027 domain-containing protein [Bacteroides sp.]MCM1414113.1 DUF2027 domain-containing protein [Bacteroides sp.]MCM1472377.1 DUF2027 domain-containing protein [Bacteroides sp.]